MKPMKKNRFTIYAAVALMSSIALMYGCKEDEVYPETRLFMPVLQEDLSAVDNTIIIDIAKIKKAVSYTLEISRDTFKTIDYTIESDTNYVVVNDELTNGDPLFWNMLYQVRVTAHAEDPQFDSKPSDLGSVRTKSFPTILKSPATYDIIDVAAKVQWETAGSGDPVTGIKVFAGSDLKLITPLLEVNVDETEQAAGLKLLEGLTPGTAYQVAIYSDEELRGWVAYTTLPADVDPTAPGVVDIRADESPGAVVNAVAGAADGSIILVKRGVKYDMPTAAINKSITIRAAYGFEPKKAQLFNTNGNWNIAGGSTIDHIRFVDLELRGGNFGGTYVFNPATDNISVSEISFENCIINTMRGIMRIRNNNVVIDNYKIINCLVDSIGGYGILTADTDPNGPPSTTAHVNNIVLQNSTFNHIQAGITSRNSSQTILIESCTFSNMITSESSNYIINYRGSAGNNEVVNGITIKNSIFGPGWNTAGTNTNNIRGKNGLPSTPMTVVNTYATNDWVFVATYEIAGFPSATYAGSQTQLWADPMKSNFNIKDQGFAGRFSAGDPRWRVKL